MNKKFDTLYYLKIGDILTNGYTSDIMEVVGWDKNFIKIDGRDWCLWPTHVAGMKLMGHYSSFFAHIISPHTGEIYDGPAPNEKQLRDYIEDAGLKLISIEYEAASVSYYNVKVIYSYKDSLDWNVAKDFMIEYDINLQDYYELEG